MREYLVRAPTVYLTTLSPFTAWENSRKFTAVKGGRTPTAAGKGCRNFAVNEEFVCSSTINHYIEETEPSRTHSRILLIFVVTVCRKRVASVKRAAACFVRRQMLQFGPTAYLRLSSYRRAIRESRNFFLYVRFSSTLFYAPGRLSPAYVGTPGRLFAVTPCPRFKHNSVCLKTSVCFCASARPAPPPPPTPR